ncbi:MAG: hypothetical protein ACM3W4_04005 [Ignavibacteriales bacterium]
MKKMSLVTGAAIGALLAVGVASQADAAPKHKAAVQSGPSAAEVQAAEIDSLREQVRILTDRLNAIEGKPAAVQQLATNATAAAQAAQAQVDTLPAQVKTEVAAATPKPKPSWADNTSVSGRMYFDVSHIDHKNNGVKQPDTGTGFDIKRFYVGVDHKFNDTYSGNITTDVTYNGNNPDKQVDVYVKKAYLQAKYSDALVVRLGSADLPWIPFAEDVYGYRYVENTLPDRVKAGTSADWGVHVSGKVADGLFSYAVSAINGNGYKNPTRSKSVDLEGRVSTTFDNVTLALGAYTGKLGKNVEGATTHHDATRWNALAAYKMDNFRIGAEYFRTKNWNSVLTTTTDSADGWSVFTSYAFTPQISAFGRYDWVKAKKTAMPTVDDNYFNVGLQWEPTKIVDFALVYKRDEAKHGLISTSNGSIGGSDKGTYDEFGVWGQYRW